MPKYTGDKFGFGVAPGEAGDGAPEVGYSTSFDNVSHTTHTEHKWVVPKTGRYNFEVWGADGGMGIRADSNNNGGIPRYGRGGKVETSLQLSAGTEIGIIVGTEGQACYSYHSNTFLNQGEGGWGGHQTDPNNTNMAFATGGNSKFNYRTHGGAGSNAGVGGWKGAGGGGGSIVRLYQDSTDAATLIVVGGGGGAGARGNDNSNSHNQGGAGGDANNKVSETQWGRRGYYAGDTSYGWPSGNPTHATSGTANQGGNGGNGYYCGGGGGGGGTGGGGSGATCSYCGHQGGTGGSPGAEGAYGNGSSGASGGGASSTNPTSNTLVGQGGNMENGNSNNQGGGGGGGYRGGGAGYKGNGAGHAGGGGGGGASSWVTDSSTYDAKGLNSLTTSPRYTSDQKPLILGNPGGGRVYIWEENLDPLGKERPAGLLAAKIQYACRSTSGGASNSSPQYYLGTGGNGSADDGGDYDYSCFNNSGYSTPHQKCDAIVMNVNGYGKWELHSVTVGQGNGYAYPYPYMHKAWVHVIEGTTTGGVGIHTEKFDDNIGGGSNALVPNTTGWFAHDRACSKSNNTEAGFIELHFDKPAVLERGQDYTIAVDWSCGGTAQSTNQGGISYMSGGHTTTRTLTGGGAGTVTWSNVTAFNGPHGLGQDNSTNTSQGQLLHFGLKSVYQAPPGGGTLGTQGNPAINAKQMFDAGERTNGYYWIKGNGSAANAREIYCIMDANWGEWSDGGGGWMVIANHDAQKQPNSGQHQPRPTSYPQWVGCDSGGQGTPSTQYMIPQESFSVEMADIPFTKVMQLVYDNSDMSHISSSNWLSYTPLCYWCSRFTTDKTIPTDSAWILVFDDKGLVLSWGGNQWLRRHLYNNNDENCEAFGCMNSSGQSPVARNGSGGNQSDPVYIATWQHNSATNNAETISWCDVSSQGYDDWQDGSGQSDQWYVESLGGKGNAQGKPSMIVVR